MRIAGTSNLADETVASQFVQKIKDDAKMGVVRRYAPTIVLVVMTLFSMIFVPGFMSWKNLNNLLYQMTLPLVLATGLTFVLLIGGIDLSLEGVMGFSGSIFTLLVLNSKNSNNLGFVAVLIVVALGFVIGATNGILHVKLRIPSFMITFAMASIAKGFGVLSYRSIPATIRSESIIALSRGSLFGLVPYMTLIAMGIFFVGVIILNYTAFGRAVYAIGDNELSARAAGINIDRVKIGVFTLCGVMISIAGLLGAVRLKIGNVEIGYNQLFPTIAAVTVGGIYPGTGGMFQTIIGVLIYTELSNYLTLMGVNTFYKQAIQGIIILVAVALSATRNRKRIVK
ncbi:MAG: ABC transporter permease [Treponema sp.]|jgi:ribose transport system permease protein|nr:ABC transporter permease [Treponema sp.]